MSNHPFFSIVIPTWNRGAELYHTLRTCLDQDYDSNDFEIVVSDNCSTDDIPAVINSLSTSRIRYVRTERHLTMTDSWNFAISQARGQYVGILATDDGYCLDLLSHCHRVLRDTKAPAMTFQGVQYHWPNSPHAEMRDKLIVTNYSFPEGMCSTRKLISEAFSTLDYGRLPTGMNSFCSREVLDRIYDNRGKVFSSYGPDIYSAIYIGSQVDEIYVSNQSMFVGGFSAGGNGAICVTDADAARRFHASHLNERMSAKLIHTDPPLLTNWVLDSMLKALADNGEKDPFSRVDVKLYAQHCYRDAAHFPDTVIGQAMKAAVDAYVMQHCPAAYASIQPNRRQDRLWRNSRFDSIRSVIRKLKNWSRSVRHAIYAPPRPWRTASGCETIDCRSRQIANVYDAALYAGSLRRRPLNAAA